MNGKTALVITETSRFSMGELCRLCSVHAEWVMELVNEGIVEPVHSGESSPKFDLIALNRVRQARRLQEDLGVNLAGVGLVLELLEELKALRKWHRNRLY